MVIDFIKKFVVWILKKYQKFYSFIQIHLLQVRLERLYGNISCTVGAVVVHVFQKSETRKCTCDTAIEMDFALEIKIALFIVDINIVVQSGLDKEIYFRL